MAAAGARERERIKWEKIKLWRGVFVNICHRGNTFYATSAWDNCVADLGPHMKHLTGFRDPDT